MRNAPHTDTIPRLYRVRLRIAFERFCRPLAGAVLACLIIFLGLWTTPPGEVHGNPTDEPRWLQRSLRADATLGYRLEEAFELNYDTLGQLSTAGYVISAGRHLLGIPPDAVKRFRGARPIDPDIRDSLIRFLTAVSSLSFLVLFAGLVRLYGYGSALAGLTLIVFAPFWGETLRPIMGESSLFLYAVLSFIGTLWLCALLSSEPTPVALLLLAASITGVFLGLAAGVKLNGLLLFVGTIAAVATLAPPTPRRTLVVVWLLAVAFVAAVIAFVLTNSLLWHPDLLDRLNLVIRFRDGEAARQQITHSSVRLAGVAASLRTTLSNSFTPGPYNLLPTLVSLPLALLGLRCGLLGRHRLARAGHVWLASIALVNALVVPLDWPRYFIFTVLAVQVFAGIGAWIVFRAVRERVSPLDVRLMSDACAPSTPDASQLGAAAIAGAVVCILCAAALALTLAASLVGSIRLNALAKEHNLAARPVERLDILNRIAQVDPGAPTLLNGEPVMLKMQTEFESQSGSRDPAVMNRLRTAAELMAAHSPDPDARARMAYELPRLGGDLSRLAVEMGVNIGPLSGPPPVSYKSDGWYLFTGKDYVEAVVSVPVEDDFNLVVTGKNIAPAPTEIGVDVDGLPLGVARYIREDDSYTDEELVAHLTAGEHVVRLRLANDAFDPTQQIDRNAVIHRLAITPAVGTAMLPALAAQLPLRLDPPGLSAMVDVTVPVPALYDVAVTLGVTAPVTPTLRITVDDLPLGVAAIPAGRSEADANPAPLGVSPVYLVPGRHKVVVQWAPNAREDVAPSAITLDRLKLEPRYPSVSDLTPPELSSAPAAEQEALPVTEDREWGAVVARLTSALNGGWKWYDNETDGHFSFFDVWVHGRSGSDGPAPVAVAIDGRPIGAVVLQPDGVAARPLLVELGTGATHTLTLSTTAPTGEPAPGVYAVELRRHVEPPVFAASAMRWAKQDNRRVTTDDSVVHLPPGVTLFRPVTIESTGAYSVTVRYRTPSDSSPRLHVGVGGWPMAETVLAPAADWTEGTFRLFLVAGEHDFRLRTAGDAAALIDLMHVIIEPADAPSVSPAS